MACSGEDDSEYESDPEEAKMSLKMRRRQASDDEDGEVTHLRVSAVDSEAESDGQGGADNYDEDEDGDEYYDEAEEEVVEGENGAPEAVAVAVAEKGVEETLEGDEVTGESESNGAQGEEEKKENEPFAVPTTGAFYMHDDRFQDNAAGRNRTFGGRRLWESKDDRKWGHDKFEQLDTRERSYEEGRRPSKGFYRGRGKGRGTDRGYAQGNRTREFGGNSNQNVAPKNVRGRGPRRYQPSMKSETLPSQNKQSENSLDRNTNTGFGRNSASTAHPNEEHESVPAKRVASNLSSASPPFYPSASSNKETALTTKKEAQPGSNSRSLRPSVSEHSFSKPMSNSVFRGKNVNDDIGMEKLHIDDSASPAGVNTVNNMHLRSSAPSSSASQVPRSRAQGRGATPSASSVFQPPQINNQISRVLPPSTQALQQNSGQNRGQAPLPASGQLLDQHALGASREDSSSPKAGKGAVQGTGRGSLMYGGKVMGSGSGMSTGDPNLPAFFPVMPFGGQHPGGMGVPAVGMAFPGYVAQPNGLGNSEMTWLPVLASAAAGALGATYCPPYIALDGSYHPRPTGQTPALPGPSKDNSPSKPNNELKPQPRSEVSHDEFSQRQNKPRRYSEMNISQ